MSLFGVSSVSPLLLPFQHLPQAGDEQGCLSSPPKPCPARQPYRTAPKVGAMEIFTLSSLGQGISVPAPSVPADSTQSKCWR